MPSRGAGQLSLVSPVWSWGAGWGSMCLSSAGWHSVPHWRTTTNWHELKVATYFMPAAASDIALDKVKCATCLCMGRAKQGCRARHVSLQAFIDTSQAVPLPRLLCPNWTDPARLTPRAPLPGTRLSDTECCFLGDKQ